MKPCVRMLMTLFGACASLAVLRPAAAAVEVPVTIPYALVRAHLAERVFIQERESLQVLTDPSGCNSLVMSAPQVRAGGSNRLRLLVRIAARGGTPVGDRCLLPFTWDGIMVLDEEPYPAAVPTAIAFRITDSSLLDLELRRATVPGVLWNWSKQYVQPRLEAFTFDLAPLIAGTRELVTSASRATPEAVAMALDSLRLEPATAGADGLVATVAFEPPYLPAAVLAATPAAPLTPDELAAWDAAWQSWDAFATWTIKRLADGRAARLREALATSLIEARYELRDALASPTRAADPVRALFLSTWSRLAPLLLEAQGDAPPDAALRLLAFTNAGAALTALDAAGSGVGLRLDQATLQRFARLLVPTLDAAELTYDTAVDPALRTLLGLAPELAMSERAPPARWYAQLLRSAHAAEVAAKPAQRLNGWVPNRNDLDAYLHTMAALLDDIAAREAGRGKLRRKFLPVYRPLLLATAWQETCWRQYVEQGGVVQPLRSRAGSVGVMQINKHVWRGVYALDRLEQDVAYNAYAGNEILVHYLVDYAIKRKEHQLSGDLHNLARATYAVYNGGPSHLRRYREPATNRSLRAIDDAFWRKYQTMRERGPKAVKQCYGG